jgi:hypothetical protein
MAANTFFILLIKLISEKGKGERERLIEQVIMRGGMRERARDR